MKSPASHYPLPITTQNLNLRPLMPGDGKVLFEAIEESRQELSAWFPWVEKTKTWEECEDTAHKFYADFILGKTMECAVFKQGLFLGMCSINEINWDVPKANLGYWIRTSQGGQGFMTEAATSLTDFAHRVMKITRVSIVCHNENLKSAQLAERCGYNLEGKSFGYQRKPGQVNPSWWRIYASVRF